MMEDKLKMLEDKVVEQSKVVESLKSLEQTVNKHNQVIDRTYQLETQSAIFQEQIANLNEDISDLQRRTNNE